MEKRSLYFLVRDTVATYAERPCYWVKADGGQDFSAVSYFNWRADMKRFSAFLVHKLGVSHGEKVGLICDNRYEWNMISMGITTTGAIDVPRGCDATAEDVKYILNHTEAEIVVVEHEKALKTILSVLPELPLIKHVISIEPAGKYKKLDQHREALGKIKLHFFLDCLTTGEEMLEQNGEAVLRKRGEAIKPDDLAAIIYTSGTTGAPKGVMLDHRSFCWEVSQVQMAYPINEHDRVVTFLPPWHIAERVLETTIIACGGSMAPSSIISLGVDLGTVKPTFLVSVPRVWEQLYKRVFDNVRKQPENKQKIFNFAQNVALTYTDLVDNLLDRFAETEEEKPADRIVRRGIALALLPGYFILNAVAQVILKKVKNILGGKIRFAISGAGALPEQVATFFRAIGVPILDGYGMTETTGLAVGSQLPWPRRGCVGKPLQGVGVQIREENGRVITRPGVKGELWHKGPHVMQGYYKEPEKTEAILKDGWLNSGDLFVWTTTGEVKFAGRAKDTIVLNGGENVEPEPIEMVLKESEFIAQAVVVGQDKKTLGALIVPNWDRCREEFKTLEISAPEGAGDWQTDKKVYKFFQDLVKQKVSPANGFKAFEKLSGFHLMHKEFEKGVEMTETQKVKRPVVFDLYEKQIAGIYRE